MKLTDTALKRPVTVLIAMAAVLIFGYKAYNSMPMERIPDVDAPIVTVTTILAGSDPEVVDNDVTDVLEEEINTISGIENLTSISYEGRSLIVVEFDLDRDIDDAAADVRDKVNMAVQDLPDEAETPTVAKFTIGDEAIVSIAITGDAPYSEKSNYADKIAKVRLQTINGVGNVDTVGLQEREIRVWLDPSKLEARGLTVSDVKNAITNKHVELPAGRLESERKEYSIKLQGEYESVEELASLPVLSTGGAVVRLADIARIEDAFEDERTYASINDEPVILLQVRKQRGANEVQIGKDTMEVLEEMKRSLPPGIQMEVVSDTFTFVQDSMSGVVKDVFLGVALCALIMLLFLRTMRATFVAMISIPLSLVGSLLIVRFFGITINNMTMLGISLSVGMVVDSTTVVLENVHRHQELGEKPFHAASIGTSEVAFAVLAGAATTVAVFGPVATMDGMIGRFFYAFGITVVTTIILSLAVSLTVTPFLTSRILKRDNPGPISRFVEKGFQKVEQGYTKLLNVAVRHRFSILALAVAVFALGIFLAGNLGKGFFPTEDRGDFTVEFELPNDVSMAQSKYLASELVEEIRKDPAVDYTISTIGSGMGQEIYKGSINVYLLSKKERGHIEDIKERLRSTLSVFKDINITLTDFGGADVELTLVGTDTRQIAAVAEKVVEDLKADGRLRDIDTDVRLNKPRLNVGINRGLADDMDINIRDLSNEIYAYFGGVDAGVYKEGGYRYDINLRAESALRSTRSDLDKIPIRNGSGEIVRVPGIITTEMGLAANQIARYNRQRSVTIQANTSEEIPQGDAIQLIMERFRDHAPADGSVRISMSGRTKNMQESFGYLINAIITAIVLVYMVMAVQFESFIHPFTVMFSLPLMSAGAFGMLTLAGLDLDVMGLLGVILLVGIVVNNAILLVDFINQQREQGVDKVTAVLRAGPLRLKAILMTALSTAIGALPVALGLSEGSEFRQPMSVALIGGLLTSTLLTLIVIPVVYLIVDDVAEKVSSFFHKKSGSSDVVQTAGSPDLKSELQYSGGE